MNLHPFNHQLLHAELASLAARPFDKILHTEFDRLLDLTLGVVGGLGLDTRVETDQIHFSHRFFRALNLCSLGICVNASASLILVLPTGSFPIDGRMGPQSSIMRSHLLASERNKINYSILV